MFNYFVNLYTSLSGREMVTSQQQQEQSKFTYLPDLSNYNDESTGARNNTTIDSLDSNLSYVSQNSIQYPLNAVGYTHTQNTLPMQNPDSDPSVINSSTQQVENPYITHGHAFDSSSLSYLDKCIETLEGIKLVNRFTYDNTPAKEPMHRMLPPGKSILRKATSSTASEPTGRHASITSRRPKIEPYSKPDRSRFTSGSRSVKKARPRSLLPESLSVSSVKQISGRNHRRAAPPAASTAQHPHTPLAEPQWKDSGEKAISEMTYEELCYELFDGPDDDDDQVKEAGPSGGLSIARCVAKGKEVDPKERCGSLSLESSDDEDGADDLFPHHLQGLEYYNASESISPDCSSDSGTSDEDVSMVDDLSSSDAEMEVTDKDEAPYSYNSWPGDYTYPLSFPSFHPAEMIQESTGARNNTTIDSLDSNLSYVSQNSIQYPSNAVGYTHTQNTLPVQNPDSDPSVINSSTQQVENPYITHGHAFDSSSLSYLDKCIETLEGIKLVNRFTYDNTPAKEPMHRMLPPGKSILRKATSSTASEPTGRHASITSRRPKIEPYSKPDRSRFTSGSRSVKKARPRSLLPESLSVSSVKQISGRNHRRAPPPAASAAQHTYTPLAEPQPKDSGEKAISEMTYEELCYELFDGPDDDDDQVKEAGPSGGLSIAKGKGVDPKERCGSLSLESSDDEDGADDLFPHHLQGLEYYDASESISPDCSSDSGASDEDVSMVDDLSSSDAEMEVTDEDEASYSYNSRFGDYTYPLSFLSFHPAEMIQESTGRNNTTIDSLDSNFSYVSQNSIQYPSNAIGYTHTQNILPMQNPYSDPSVIDSSTQQVENPYITHGHAFDSSSLSYLDKCIETLEGIKLVNRFTYDNTPAKEPMHRMLPPGKSILRKATSSTASEPTGRHASITSRRPKIEPYSKPDRSRFTSGSRSSKKARSRSLLLESFSGSSVNQISGGNHRRAAPPAASTAQHPHTPMAEPQRRDSGEKAISEMTYEELCYELFDGPDDDDDQVKEAGPSGGLSIARCVAKGKGVDPKKRCGGLSLESSDDEDGADDLFPHHLQGLEYYDASESISPDCGSDSGASDEDVSMVEDFSSSDAQMEVTDEDRASSNNSWPGDYTSPLSFSSFHPAEMIQVWN
ncbi:hypothetical protein BU17DRAFT_87992 [Hysterangium stoloniferum]|nr:hypothetical protein BU17DRAFT_87992 [Hysterangium stoloniferum]